MAFITDTDKFRILADGSLVWAGDSVSIAGMRASELRRTGKEVVTETRERGGPWKPVDIT